MKKLKKNWIVLTREDLISSEKNKSFDNVSICDFKQSSISRDEIEKVSLLSFIEGANTKILKDRFCRI